MTSSSDVVSRYIQQAFWDDPKFLRYNSVSANIYPASRAGTPLGHWLLSYGTHFPLAIPMRDETGDWWLLNGDNYSVTTSKHQSWVRNEISKTDKPSVIIPFTAIEAARIDKFSIRIIEAQEERNITHEMVSSDINDVPIYRRHVMNRVPVQPGEDGKFRWVTFEYGPEGAHNVDHVVDTWEEVPPSRQYDSVPGEIQPDENGLYHWDRFEHFLGASVFRARYRHTTKKGDQINRSANFLSAFDMNEPESSRHYFLAQLPPGKVESVDDAYEILQPEIVKQAIADGREVRRQGDIFAIEMPEIDTREIRSAPGSIQGRMNAKINTLEIAIPQNGYVNYASYDRGILAKSKCTEENFRLFAALWNLGQFFLGGQRPAAITEIEIEDPVLVPASRLLGTSHVGTETVRLKDGTTYARGTLRHRPFSGTRMWGAHSDSEHAMCKLGKHWHLIVQNRVPKDHQGQSRAWQVLGNVD